MQGSAIEAKAFDLDRTALAESAAYENTSPRARAVAPYREIGEIEHTAPDPRSAIGLPFDIAFHGNPPHIARKASNALDACALKSSRRGVQTTAHADNLASLATRRTRFGLKSQVADVERIIGAPAQRSLDADFGASRLDLDSGGDHHPIVPTQSAHGNKVAGTRGPKRPCVLVRKTGGHRHSLSGDHEGAPLGIDGPHGPNHRRTRPEAPQREA